MTRSRISTTAPAISDYALIGDCHGVALVSRHGAIDWCCMPRPDSGSCFGRLLDLDRGGTCRVAPTVEATATRRYLDDTLVLETTFRTGTGVLRILDGMAMPVTDGRSRIVRVIECVEGTVPVQGLVRPRFEYGALRPWIRQHGPGVFSAIGGSTGLIVRGSLPLSQSGDHDLIADVELTEGQSATLSISFAPPEHIDADPPGPRDDAGTGELDSTVEWWRAWVRGSDGQSTAEERRSAIVLKALSYQPTGAFVAAPTTSLPESPGGARNWDYRYSWIRDSAFAIRALVELGLYHEAQGFRMFAERSAAGSAEELQLMYGVGGEIRLPEVELPYLSGYRDSRPVRIGNAAFPQRQLDLYGYLLDLAWRWHQQGVTPTEPYWRFLVDLVDAACEQWTSPDRGIWEVRGEPRHFVHSKVMCWSAVDCGLRLAEKLGLDAPVDRWATTRDTMRHTIETRGYDQDRGVFVRSFDEKDLDAALLLIPWVDFVGFDDPRMVRTADEIRSTLDNRGLIHRYTADDGLEGQEGVFVACSFWLAECLARQGRPDDAREVFHRAVATSNDLGLYSEEFDPATGEQLGNFPQAMSHFSHITAFRALRESATAPPPS